MLNSSSSLLYQGLLPYKFQPTSFEQSAKKVHVNNCTVRKHINYLLSLSKRKCILYIIVLNLFNKCKKIKLDKNIRTHKENLKFQFSNCPMSLTIRSRNYQTWNTIMGEPLQSLWSCKIWKISLKVSWKSTKVKAFVARKHINYPP